MRNRLCLLLGLALAGSFMSVRPTTAADFHFCAGNARPQVCVHEISGFGGTVQEYGVTTGGPAGSGDEAYRVELLCGDGPLRLRIGETDRGLGLGLGFQTISLLASSMVCPKVLTR